MDLLKRLKLSDYNLVPELEFMEFVLAVALSEEWVTYTCFPKSYGLISSWDGRQGFSSDVYRGLKKKISEISAEYWVKAQDIIDGDAADKKLAANFNLNDLSRDLARFKPLIRRLGYMENGLELAFELLLFLGRQSNIYTNPVQTHGTYQNNRKLDGPTDHLLLELAHRLEGDDVALRIPRELITEVKMLHEDVKYLAHFGIETYFPASSKLPDRWDPRSSSTTCIFARSHQIKDKITKTYDTLHQRYKKLFTRQGTPHFRLA